MVRCKYLTCLLMLFAGKNLSAQETQATDSAQKLQEIIVVYQAVRLTPITFQNLDEKDLKRKSTGQEPSFILSETPSVTVYADAGSTQGYSYFRMRGIDQTRINISLDGMPLNEPEDQGAYFSNYPDIFNSVSKVQVQRGVGTSKNGIASYGGSIQLFTSNLSDTSQMSLGMGYGSFKSFRLFGTYNRGIKKGKGFYIRASDIGSEGYKYHSSNHAQSLFLSQVVLLKKSSWRINLLAGHQQNELAWLGVADSLISLDRRTNANKNEHDQFFQGLFQVVHNWQLNPRNAVQSCFYFTHLKGNYDFNLNGFMGLPITNELYNYAFLSNLFGFFSNYTFTGKSFTWITGIHGNTYNREHIGSERTIGRLYTNTGRKQEYSVFSKLNYSWRQLTLFADVQYRYTSFDYMGTIKFQSLPWHFMNPKVGISYEIKPHTVLYYSLGGTSREPTRNDIFGGNDDLLQDSSGKPVLYITSPERVQDQELGLRFKTQKLNIGFNLYWMDFKNEIILDGKFGPNGLLLTNSVDQSFRKGMEISLHYKVFDKLSYITNASLNYSRIKEKNTVFQPVLTPGLIINQEVNYILGPFSATLINRYQEKSYIDFANTAFIQSYFLWNARLGYETGKFQWAVFLNNLTNSKYYNNGYLESDGTRKYFVQAPFHFYLSMVMKF